MSNFLTDGSAVAVRRNGHHRHRISVRQISMCVITWKTCVDTRDELLQRIFDTSRRVNDATVLHKVKLCI